MEFQEISKYLDKNLDSLESKIRPNIMEKLRQHTVPALTYEVPKNYNGSIIDYLFLQHQGQGRSLGNLAREIGFSGDTLSKIFRCYSLPIVDPKEGSKAALKSMWQTTEFRDKQIKGRR